MVIELICPGLRAQLLDVLTPTNMLMRLGDVVGGLIQLLDWVLGLGAVGALLAVFLVWLGFGLMRRKHGT